MSRYFNRFSRILRETETNDLTAVRLICDDIWLVQREAFDSPKIFWNCVPGTAVGATSATGYHTEERHDAFLLLSDQIFCNAILNCLLYRVFDLSYQASTATQWGARKYHFFCHNDSPPYYHRRTSLPPNYLTGFIKSIKFFIWFYRILLST